MKSKIKVTKQLVRKAYGRVNLAMFPTQCFLSIPLKTIEKLWKLFCLDPKFKCSSYLHILR